MATTIFEVFGIVRSDGTLEVEHKLAVPPGRVKVRVESMEPPSVPHETLVEFVQRSRRELEAVGHRFRTKEEIDAEIEEMRSEWNDPVEELERLMTPGTEGRIGLSCQFHDRFIDTKPTPGSKPDSRMVEVP